MYGLRGACAVQYLVSRLGHASRILSLGCLPVRTPLQSSQTSGSRGRSDCCSRAAEAEAAERRNGSIRGPGLHLLRRRPTGRSSRTARETPASRAASNSSRSPGFPLARAFRPALWRQVVPGARPGCRGRRGAAGRRGRDPQTIDDRRPAGPRATTSAYERDGKRARRADRLRSAWQDGVPAALPLRGGRRDPGVRPAARDLQVDLTLLLGRHARRARPRAPGRSSRRGRTRARVFVSGGSSPRSGSFSLGRITRFKPARCAASTFSRTPPIGSTWPVSVISPVMPTSSETGLLAHERRDRRRHRDSGRRPVLRDRAGRDVDVHVVLAGTSPDRGRAARRARAPTTRPSAPTPASRRRAGP